MPREKMEDGGARPDEEEETHEPFWCLSKEKRHEDTHARAALC